MATFPKQVQSLIIGETYYVQSCTKDWVGRLVSIDGPYCVVLEEASWIANSGRMGEFVRTGKTSNMETEFVGVVSVQWVNWISWPHKPFNQDN